MRIFRTLRKIATVVIIGCAIFYSYHYLTWFQPLGQFLADLAFKVLGQDGMEFLAQHFNLYDLRSVILIFTHIPTAIVCSLAWVLAAKHIILIKEIFPSAILVAILPFVTLFIVFYYLNIVMFQRGVEDSLYNSGYHSFSEALVIAYFPYYMLLLAFKAFLLKDPKQT